MKRILAFVLMLMVCVACVGCGSNTVQQGANNDKVRDLPEGNYEEKGEGIVYISTPSGTSEDGNVPVVYAASDVMLMQIGLNAWDFNGNALSYIYIDGMLNTKEQLANSQISLTLENEQLKSGIHVVEVVQYTNDDPAADMITYKTMSYEIKED